MSLTIDFALVIVTSLIGSYLICSNALPKVGKRTLLPVVQENKLSILFLIASKSFLEFLTVIFLMLTSLNVEPVILFF